MDYSWNFSFFMTIPIDNSVIICSDFLLGSTGSSPKLSSNGSYKVTYLDRLVCSKDAKSAKQYCSSILGQCSYSESML